MTSMSIPQPFALSLYSEAASTAPLECHIGGVELDFEITQARLLEVEAGLVGIVAPLGQLLLGRDVAVEVADGMVVSELSVAEQDIVENLPARTGVLDGQSYVVVVEGRCIGTHRQGVVLVAVLHDDVEPLDRPEAIRGGTLDAVDDVDIARTQRRRPGVHVLDGNRLDLVEVRMPVLPVVGIAAGECTHTGIPGLQHVTAGADAGVEVRGSHGIDLQARVRKQEGKIGVSGIEANVQTAGSVVLQLHDRGEQCLQRRLVTDSMLVDVEFIAIPPVENRSQQSFSDLHAVCDAVDAAGVDLGLVDLGSRALIERIRAPHVDRLGEEPAVANTLSRLSVRAQTSARSMRPRLRRLQHPLIHVAARTHIVDGLPQG